MAAKKLSANMRKLLKKRAKQGDPKAAEALASRTAPRQKPDAESLRSRLFDESDSLKSNRIIDRLKSLGKDGDPLAKQVLFDYAVTPGRESHLAFSASISLAQVLVPSDVELAEKIRRHPWSPDLAYSFAGCLLAIEEQRAWPFLVDKVLENSLEPETARLIVEKLVSASRRSLLAGCPSVHWTHSDVPVAALEAWKASGFPMGSVVNACPNPSTALEKAVNRLSSKLMLSSSPYLPRLVAADREVLAEIESRGSLPAVYREFLQRFSPENVQIELRYSSISLFGSKELLVKQVGYSEHVEGGPLPGWPDSYLVVAQCGGDPFCIDISQGDDSECPVWVAQHGWGEWDFGVYADTFVKFLRLLARKKVPFHR